MDRRKRQEFGSDLIRTRLSREPYFLQKRTWRDLKFWEWIFIVFSLLSIAISIGFSVFQLILAIYDKAKYIFPVLVILNNIFSVYFLWNGVMEELPFKILLQLVVKCIVWIFDLIFFLMPGKEVEIDEESELRQQIREIRFYISSSMLFLTVATGLFVIYQYWTSNINLFRVVGTEPKYVKLRRRWNFCHSMMLFDAVIFITVIFHLCNFPYFVTSFAAFYLLPLWLLVTVIYVVLGIQAIERESRVLTYFFYVLSHSQPIFVIFMLVKATQSSLGLLLYVSLYVTSLISLFAHIGLLISVVRLQGSFGMGLKQAAARVTEHKQLVETVESQYNNTNGTTDESTSRPAPTETEL